LENIGVVFLYVKNEIVAFNPECQVYYRLFGRSPLQKFGCTLVNRFLDVVLGGECRNCYVNAARA
jgi:hypothetical protein